MSKKIVGLGAVAVLVVGWAAGTWVSGNKVQTTLLEQASAWQPKADAAKPALRLIKVDYDKGFLGATRTLTVAMGCDNDTRTLSWRDRIQHGPLPGFTGFGAARIDSELVLTDAQRAELKKLTGQDQFEAKLRTTVGFGGSSKSWLDVPAFTMQSGDQGSVSFKGLSALLTRSADGASRYEFNLPEYSVSTPAGASTPGMVMRFTGAKGQGVGLAPLWWAFAGKGSGSLQSMEVQIAGADGQTKPVFSLQDLSYTQDGQLQNGLYGASMQMKGKGMAAGKALEAVAMQFSMKNLHADSYSRFMLNAMYASCPAEGVNPQQQAEQLFEPLKALLPHNPSMSLDALTFTLGGKTLSLSYSLGTQGVSADDLKAPSLVPVMMKKAQVKANFEAPVAMLVELSELMGKPVPLEVVEQGVAQAAAQGMLVRKGDAISASLDMREGSLTVNGKPMPLPGQAPAAPVAP
jgi:uncharacterized protein YdgA (DUF945 family)